MIMGSVCHIPFFLDNGLLPEPTNTRPLSARKTLESHLFGRPLTFSRMLLVDEKAAYCTVFVFLCVDEATGFWPIPTRLTLIE